MREAHITLPELGLVAGTRGMLGAGLGLLLADRLPEAQRKAVGWTLFLVGVVTTVPGELPTAGPPNNQSRMNAFQAEFTAVTTPVSSSTATRAGRASIVPCISAAAFSTSLREPTRSVTSRK